MTAPDLAGLTPSERAAWQAARDRGAELPAAVVRAMVRAADVERLAQLAERHGVRQAPEASPADRGPVPLSDTPGTPCPSGYEGCQHDLTVHSADLGCWLCDCTYGRPSDPATVRSDTYGEITRAELADLRAAARPCLRCGMLADVDPELHASRYGHAPVIRDGSGTLTWSSDAWSWVAGAAR
jgi:hypothetical protein